MLYYNTIQQNTIQYNTTHHNTTQHNTTQHNTIQYNTIQYNTTIQNHTINIIHKIIDLPVARILPYKLTCNPKHVPNKNETLLQTMQTMGGVFPCYSAGEHALVNVCPMICDKREAVEQASSNANRTLNAAVAAGQFDDWCAQFFHAAPV